MGSSFSFLRECDFGYVTEVLCLWMCTKPGYSCKSSDARMRVRVPSPLLWLLWVLGTVLATFLHIVLAAHDTGSKGSAGRAHSGATVCQSRIGMPPTRGRRRFREFGASLDDTDDEFHDEDYRPSPTKRGISPALGSMDQLPHLARTRTNTLAAGLQGEHETISRPSRIAIGLPQDVLITIFKLACGGGGVPTAAVGGLRLRCIALVLHC